MLQCVNVHLWCCSHAAANAQTNSASSASEVLQAHLRDLIRVGGQRWRCFNGAKESLDVAVTCFARQGQRKV